MIFWLLLDPDPAAQAGVEINDGHRTAPYRAARLICLSHTERRPGASFYWVLPCDLSLYIYIGRRPGTVGYVIIYAKQMKIESATHGL